MPAEPFRVVVEDCLALHEASIELYGVEHGVRDMGLLESALAQPWSGFGDHEAHPTIAAKAAAYMYFVTGNHPFLEGDERTAFGAMWLFLRLNGYRLALSDDEKYGLVKGVVSGELGLAAVTAMIGRALVDHAARSPHC